jgi:hypothetical protein
MSDTDRIDVADVVKHGPSGETWVVAFADHESGHLWWCGWPEGTAKLSDCTIIRKATDEQRDGLLESMANGNTNDARTRYAKWRLSHKEPTDAN